MIREINTCPNYMTIIGLKHRAILLRMQQKEVLMPKRTQFSTDVIHAGQENEPQTGAVIPPIYATSTFANPHGDCMMTGFQTGPCEGVIIGSGVIVLLAQGQPLLVVLFHAVPETQIST